MKEVVIYEFQLKEIIDALRLTANLNGCRTKKTAFDRTVMAAYQFAENALEGNKDKHVTRL